MIWCNLWRSINNFRTVSKSTAVFRSYYKCRPNKNVQQFQEENFKNSSSNNDSDKKRSNNNERKTNWARNGFYYATFWQMFKVMIGYDKVVLDDDVLKNNIKLAVLAASEKKFDEAFELLHVALKQAQSKKSESAENYVIDMMANLYYSKGEYDPAEKLFTDLLHRLLIKGMPQNDPAVIEISLKLADIYGKNGDHEKAELGFQFCIEAARGHVMNADQEYANRWVGKAPDKSLEYDLGGPRTNLQTDCYALYGMVLEVYAQYLVNQGKVQESVEYMNRCLELSHEIYGVSNTHTITLLNNYAVVCLNQKAYQTALKYMTEAVNRVTLKPELANELPGYYCNYAEILWHCDQKDKAIEYARKAVDAAKQSDEDIQNHAKGFLSNLEKEAKSKK